MKKICAITMARNDDFFLTRWIAHYGRELGKENLYIFLDGEDQPIPKNAEGVNITHRKRVAEQVVAADKSRVKFLSQVAEELLQRYDMVIGVDADEFLVVDPKCGKSLTEYLSSIKCNPCVSGLGLDIGQNMNTEAQLDEDLPFMQQRSYALLLPRYTKSSVISKPVKWGSGFHRVKGHKFRIDPNLYLFHFGSVDMEMIRQRFLDKDRMASGLEKHIKKRARTIHLITDRNAKIGEKWLKIARRIQRCLRPVYALNKPSMAGWKLIVKLPDRFKTTC